MLSEHNTDWEHRVEEELPRMQLGYPCEVQRYFTTDSGEAVLLAEGRAQETQ
jgi:hypothetical protein